MEQLAKMAELVNANTAPYANAGIYWKLIADINLGVAPYNTDPGWTPIGTPNPFSGYFDGNGKIVSGLMINRPSADYIGLFSINCGTIKNLGVAGKVIGGNFIGGLAGGISDGSIITNCYAEVEVKGFSAVGGLVGDTDVGSSITNCYATGMVNGTIYGAGGVVGALRGSIANCYATGMVSSSGADLVGGMVGRMDDALNNIVSYCAALNPSITSVGSRVMRIAGNGYFLTSTLSNPLFCILHAFRRLRIMRHPNGCRKQK